MEIHQLLPDIAYGDAISNHAFALKSFLKAWGYTSEIYVLRPEKTVAAQVKRLGEFNPKKDDLILYHYSIGCKKVSRFFQRARGRKAIIYHNITPHQYF